MLIFDPIIFLLIFAIVSIIITIFPFLLIIISKVKGDNRVVYASFILVLLNYTSLLIMSCIAKNEEDNS